MLKTSRLDAAALLIAVVVVGLPALATSDGFASDYTNHLWLVWVQDRAISEHGLPSYFLHADAAGGVFNPFFQFYGGTLYATSGALAALLGNRPHAAYVGYILLSIAAAYGGMLWLARQLGARGWMAHAPAVTFVSSAYYVTNIYGRGAWPEAVAVSAIPLFVASGVHIARSTRPQPLPCALFALSAVVWTGSHNITFAWGTVVLVATLAALRLLIRRPLVASRTQIGWLLGLLGLAVCANAWFLLPDVLHSGSTQIVSMSKFSWDASRDFNTPWALFDPLRHVPKTSTTPALYVQAPVWFLGWAVAAVFVGRSGMTRSRHQVVVALGLVLVAILALIMVKPLWSIVPEPLQLIQIPYRLGTYVSLLVASLVLVGVLAAQSATRSRERRALGAGLAVAMGVSIGLSVWQLWVPNTHHRLSYDDLHDAFVSVNVAPRTWYDSNAYLDADQPVVKYAADRVLHVDPAGFSGNRVTRTVTPPPGPAPFVVTTGAGPQIVHLRGLVRLGRTASGLAVVRRPDDGSGPVRITLEAAGGATTVGAAISMFGILGIAASLACVVVRARR